jgi:flagellar hook protein FlgE
VSGSRQLFSQGQVQTSANTLDMAINGKGFYRVQRSDGSFGYTRSGSYNLDKVGNIVDPAGDLLTGYLPDAAGTGISVGLLKSLTVDTRNSVPKVTTAAMQNVLLDSRQTSVASASLLTPAGLVYQKTMQMWNIANNSPSGTPPTITDLAALATNELKQLTSSQAGAGASVGINELPDVLDTINRLKAYYSYPSIVPSGDVAKSAAFTKDLNAILAKVLPDTGGTYPSTIVPLSAYASGAASPYIVGAISFGSTPTPLAGKNITSALVGTTNVATFHLPNSTAYTGATTYSFTAPDAQFSPFETTGVYDTLFPQNLTFPTLTGSVSVNSANADLDGGISYSTAATNVKDFSIGDSSTYTSTTLSTIYDKQGKDHTLQTYYVKRSADQWDIYSAVDGVGTNMAVRAADPLATPPVTAKSFYFPNFTVNFDQTGNLQSVGQWTAQGGDPATAFVPPAADNYTAVDPKIAPVKYELTYTDGSNLPQTFSLDITKTQQYATDFLAATQQDGFPTGQFQNVTVDKDGKLYAHYSSGASNIVGQVVLATFPSETNLAADRNNQFVETAKSGAAVYNTPGTGGSGQILGSSVETSSVDLTSEMIKLISAQRTYQANSEVVKREDQIMQTIIGIGQ